MPGRYTLEVSAARASSAACARRTTSCGPIGSEVTVKTRTEVDGERRFRGTLVAADDAGITVRLADDAGERTLAHDEIEQARTVFDWGPAPKPGQPKSSPARNQRKKASAR